MGIFNNIFIPAVASAGLFIFGIAVLNALVNNLLHRRRLSAALEALLYAVYSWVFALVPLSAEGLRLMDFRFAILIYAAYKFKPLQLFIFIPAYLAGIFFSAEPPIPHILASIYSCAVMISGVKKNLKAALLIFGTVPVIFAGLAMGGALDDFSSRLIITVSAFAASAVAGAIVSVLPAAGKNILGTNTLLIYAAKLACCYEGAHKIVINREGTHVMCSDSFRREYEISGTSRDVITYGEFMRAFGSGVPVASAASGASVKSDTSVHGAFAPGEDESEILSGKTKKMVIITPETGRYKYISIIIKKSIFGYRTGQITDISREIGSAELLHEIMKKDYMTGLKSYYVLKDDLLTNARQHPGIILQINMGIIQNTVMKSLLAAEFTNKCMKTVAQTLLAEFRDAHIYSAGGNGFQIVFFGLDRGDAAPSYVDKVVKIFREPFYIDERRVFFTADIGVKTSESLRYSTYNDFDNLLARVEWAKEMAIKKGRGSIYYYAEKDYEEALEEYKKAQLLLALIEEGEFYPVFQPIVDTSTGEIFAYEVLTRIKDQYYTSISDLIEDSLLFDLGTQLDTRIIERLCATITSGDICCSIFMNKLANTPITDEIKTISEYLRGRGKTLYVEFTEYDRQEVDDLLFMISQLESQKIKAVIDDYGKANSSPLILSSVNPAVVKIDRSIVNGVSEDRRKEVMLKGILEYCASFGIATVAEGISQENDFIKAAEMGADYIQGFYIARPEEKPPFIRREIREKLIEISRRRIEMKPAQEDEKIKI